MQRACRVIAILCLLSASASAKEFTVSDQDQSNILNICDTASMAPSLTRNVRAAVAAWCVDWAKRVEAASSGPSSSVNPADGNNDKPAK